MRCLDRTPTRDRGRHRRVESDRRRGVLPDPPHAIEPGLRSASTGGQVHRTVRTEGEVGDVEGPTFEERHRGRDVTRTLGLQIDRDDATVRPVAEVHPVPPRRRERRTMPAHHARRTPCVHLEGRRPRIRRFDRPLHASPPPAELAARDHVHESRTPVPRGPDVPFHVSVVGEEFAVRGEVEVVGVPESTRDDLPLGAVEIGAKHQAARRHLADRMATGIPDPLEHGVLRPVRVRAGLRDRLRRHAVVPDRGPDHAVGSEHQSVRAVLRTVAVRRQVFRDLEAVVAVAILQSPETAGATGIVDHARVEIVTDEEQSVGATDRFVQSFDDDLGSGVLRNRDPLERAVLRGHHDPPPRIDGHRTPRAFSRLRGMEQFDGETLGNRDRLHRRGHLHREGILPRTLRRRGRPEVDEIDRRRDAPRQSARGPGIIGDESPTTVGTFDQDHRRQTRRTAVVGAVEADGAVTGRGIRDLHFPGPGPVASTKKEFIVEVQREPVVRRRPDEHARRTLGNHDLTFESTPFARDLVGGHPDPPRHGIVRAERRRQEGEDERDQQD